MRRYAKKKIDFWKKKSFTLQRAAKRRQQKAKESCVDAIANWRASGWLCYHAIDLFCRSFCSTKAGRQSSSFAFCTSQSNELLFCIIIDVVCALTRGTNVWHAINSVEDVCSLHGNDAAAAAVALRSEGECHYWIWIHWCVIACHMRFESNIGFTGNRVEVNQFEQRQRQSNDACLHICSQLLGFVHIISHSHMSKRLPDMMNRVRHRRVFHVLCMFWFRQRFEYGIRRNWEKNVKEKKMS